MYEVELDDADSNPILGNILELDADHQHTHRVIDADVKKT